MMRDDSLAAILNFAKDKCPDGESDSLMSHFSTVILTKPRQESEQVAAVSSFLITVDLLCAYHEAAQASFGPKSL